LATKATGLSGRPVDRQSLHSLLEEAAAAIGHIEAYEDYLPEDPRDDVRVTVSNQIFRLGPGEVERPLADVDRALLVAESTRSRSIETVSEFATLSRLFLDTKPPPLRLFPTPGRQATTTSTETPF
jgi:hypothetical protein